MTTHDKHVYYLRIARLVADRATCPRARCGAVLVREDGILATGFNGSPRGDVHCSGIDAGCVVEGGHCVRSIHAEANAIYMAARNGVSLKGATLYSLQRPCNGCLSAVWQAGIELCYYAYDYHSAAHGDKYMSPYLMYKIPPILVKIPDYNGAEEETMSPFLQSMIAQEQYAAKHGGTSTEGVA